MGVPGRGAVAACPGAAALAAPRRRCLRAAAQLRHALGARVGAAQRAPRPPVAVSLPSYVVTTPAPRDVWTQLQADDAAAPPFQSPAWTDCVVQVGGGRDVSRLYELADGRQLVLPLVRTKHTSGRW